LLITLFLGALQCHATDPIDEEVERLTASIVPPNSKQMSSAPVSRDAKSANAQWIFECRMGWVRYTQWLQEVIAPDYEIKRATSETLVFRRILDGDIYTVTFQSADSGRVIVARFLAEPF
jgi:hypothetical protein